MTLDDVPVNSLRACSGCDIRAANGALTAVVVGHRIKDGKVYGISVRFYDADGLETNSRDRNYPGNGHDVVYAWSWEECMRKNKLRMIARYHSLESALVERERIHESW